MYTVHCTLSMVTYNWDYILGLITCLNSLHVYIRNQAEIGSLKMRRSGVHIIPSDQSQMLID